MQTATNENFYSTRHRKAALRLVEHARKRKQQRAISAERIELIVFFGDRTYDGRGGIRCVMTSDALARLEKVLGHTSRMENLRDCYAVLNADDERTVITVGHLYV